MNFYCTTEHCSCMGIKRFSAGKAIRCTAESCENKYPSRPAALANGTQSRRACA